MAYSTADTAGGDYETADQVIARLQAMQRAADELAAAQAAGTAGPTGTTQATPTTTYAQENPLPEGALGAPAYAPYGGYDMDALRRAAADAAAQANAANATQSQYMPGYEPGAQVGSTGTTTQSTGSQYMPGSEPTPYSPAEIPTQSIPQQTTTDTNALQRALERSRVSASPTDAATSGSTGQSDLSTKAATSGSLGTTQPPTGLTGSLATTPTTTGISVGDAFSKMTQGINNQVTGAGAGTGTTDTSALARAAGTADLSAAPGPSGAGSSNIDQGAGAGSGGQSLGALTNSIVGQLQSIGQSALAPGSSPDAGATYMQYAQNILKLLDDQEAQLRAENEKQGTTLDPSTAFAIDTIRQNLEENLKTTREDLNRRGVLDSGITYDLEAKFRKGSASDQAMLMASRLSKLQDQLTQGLSAIRSQKVSTLSSFGRDAAQAGFTASENAKKNAYQREQDALRGMLDLRGQVSGEQNAAANRSFQGQESALSRAFNAEQANLDRQYGDAQNRAKTAAEFEQNRLAYEREKALIDQRAAAGVYTSGGGSGSARPAARTTAAPAGAQGDITDQAIAEMKGMFTNAADAQAAIQDRETLRKLAAAGVDIAALVDAAQGIGTAQGWGGSRRIGTSDY